MSNSFNITLKLNRNDELENHSSASWLLNEIKHNQSKLIAATIGTDEVIFSLERPEKQRYLVCFHHTSSNGTQEVLTSFYEPLGGKMTDRAILAFELMHEQKYGRKFVAVRSWQKVDSE